MARLAPPIINGTIPAFNGDINVKHGTAKIAVPFAMNRAVSRGQVKSFELKLKTIASSTYLATLNSTNIDWENMVINFEIDQDLLNIGQFYKIQVAYVDMNNEIGYYSAISTIKFTSKPDIKIDDLSLTTINHHKPSYIGVYTQPIEGDITEKVYKYNFSIYDINNNLIVTSGTKVHNSTEDLECNTSYDVFECQYELQFGVTYYIQYSVLTINDMEISTKKYRIQQKNSINPNLNATVEAKLNYDNGYISICLNPKYENGNALGSNGAFELSRASEESDYSFWEVLTHISYHNETAQGEIFKDFTIEQGKTYIYGIAQYSDDGIYSNRKISNKIYSDFEDIFLFDGVRQLKVRYNPQVSTFKTNLLEQKTDTIGSKFPFIFRNGNVNYKELAISGLLSYWSDEEKLFITNKDLGLKKDNQIRTGSLSKTIENFEIQTTNLTSYNIMAEREFKLQALDWLNNGEIKLFRSPTEGNYLVRIMNVALQPNQQVGRMIHTFTCQAYEMDECNYNNLVKYNIINGGEINEVSLKWAFVNINNLLQDGKTIQKILNGNIKIDYVAINENQLTTLKIEGLMPGTIIFLDDQPIVIGITGAYTIDENIKINKVYLPLNALKDGVNSINIVYSYYDKNVNVFDNISLVENSIVPTQKFWNGEEIISFLTKIPKAVKNSENKIEYNNGYVENIKDKISIIKKISFSLKNGIGQKLYKLNDKEYYTRNILDAQDISNSYKYIYDLNLMNPYYVYPVYSNQLDENNNEIYLGMMKYNSQKKVFLIDTTQNFDNMNLVTIVSGNEVNPTTEILDLTDSYYFETEFLTDIPASIKLGSNVMADVTYASNLVEYKIETKDQEVKQAKKDWEKSKKDFESYRSNIKNLVNKTDKEIIDITSELSEARENVKLNYSYFISLLQEALQKEE